MKSAWKPRREYGTGKYYELTGNTKWTIRHEGYKMWRVYLDWHVKATFPTLGEAKSFVESKL